VGRGVSVETVGTGVTVRVGGGTVDGMGLEGTRGCEEQAVKKKRKTARSDTIRNLVI
jgi:hypothetical protein